MALVPRVSVVLAAQLLLSVAAVALVAERVRWLLYRAPLDTSVFLAALGRALEDRDEAGARAMAERGRPAAVAEIATHVLSGAGELDEVRAELSDRIMARLFAVKVVGRVGTALGFLGAILWLIWMMSGDHGLLALKAGLVEKIAVEGALLSMTLGVATSVFCMAALSILRRAAVALVKDVDRTIDRLGGGPALADAE
jgi:hypothetical protein